MNFGLKNEKLCINNDEFCIKTDDCCRQRFARKCVS